MKRDLTGIYQALHGEYGYRNWWPIVSGGKCLYLDEFRERERTPGEILEIMIGAILTQNTAWDNVVRTLVALKKKKMLTRSALGKAPHKTLASVLRPSGYFNQKAKKVKHMVRFIDGELRGDLSRLAKMEMDTARSKLLDVWGVGPETADSILLYGYGMSVFVVDAYTKRIFSRLGFFKKDADYESVRNFFEDRLEKDPLLFQEYHAVIVEHGKNVCKSKPVCDKCLLKKQCAYAGDGK
jgi:endonuclease-3 related protein